MAAPWWENGLRFQCQGSGKCCLSRGAYGYVYLTLSDRRALAKHFGLPTAKFTRLYCEKGSEQVWRLKDFTDSCRFLDGKACSVYEARPTQCRTWPFWPETLSAKAWKKEVAAFCPGVGKGKVWTGDEIRRQLDLQRHSEAQY